MCGVAGKCLTQTKFVMSVNVKHLNTLRKAQQVTWTKYDCCVPKLTETLQHHSCESLLGLCFWYPFEKLVNTPSNSISLSVAAKVLLQYSFSLSLHQEL